jgi:epoxyqueuosine reductase
MSDTENPLSRRDFLKNMGLTGMAAGIAGTVGLTAAGESLGSPMAGGVHRRPWWIRQVEEPTTGIDWSVMQRIDATNTLQPEGLGKYVTPDENARLLRLHGENEMRRIVRQEPGFSQKEDALQHAFQSGRNALHRSFLGPQTALQPQERGLARWEASPEENTAMLKTAMRQMGAGTIGIVHLNERTRKLIYSVDLDGKPIVFDDVQRGYEDDDKRVIPTHAEWVVVYTVQMSDVAMKRAPTKIAEMATTEAYQRGLMIQNNVQEFLRALGYQAMGEAVLNGLGIAPAFAVLGGLGELSRLNRVITPEYGPMVRIFKFVTDLPLEADKPIDAGIARFCKSCKKCAEACPPAALSFDTEPNWQPVGAWSNAGHQAWFEDSLRCKRYWHEELGTNCGICFAVCPFSKRNASFMHDLIRMQIALSPTFNDIMRNVDDAFGYGVQKSPDQWWSLDLPEFGIDTGRD